MSDSTEAKAAPELDAASKGQQPEAVTLAAPTKRSREEDEDESELQEADGEHAEETAEVRDANGELVGGAEHDDGENKPAKRRKSEPESKSETVENEPEVQAEEEVNASGTRETTAELEAQANETSETDKKKNLEDLPSEFPDSEDDEADKNGKENKINDKTEDATTESVSKDKEDKEQKVETPSTPSGFVSASTTFTGGFGSFVKSGFVGTPKTNIFGGSSAGSGGAGTTSSASSPASAFKSGFSGFGSAFSTPKKDSPWTEAGETPKAAPLKSMFGGGTPIAATSGKDESSKASSEGEGEDATGEETNGANGGEDLYVVQLATPLEQRKVETGEEKEVSVFSCRAKLYVLDLANSDAGWKERGVGTLHVNSSKDEGQPKSRLVMRVDGSLRVVLNLPWVKSFKVMEGMKSSLQSEKFVRISAVEENNKPVQYALRMNNAETTKNLFKTIQGLVPS